MEDIFGTLAGLQKTGKPAALAIVIRTEGSVPRKTGAKMIILLSFHEGFRETKLFSTSFCRKSSGISE